MRPIFLFVSLTLICVAPVAAQRSTPPRVEFELITEQGFPLTGAQRWVDLFKKFDRTTVRIRSARPGDKAAVTNRGTDASPSYHVLGYLLASDQLQLPTRRRPYRVTDREEIAKWIENLQADGVGGLTEQKHAFGLTSEQLVAFHERVSKPVQFETKGVRAGDIARRVVRDLGIDVDVTSSARAAFARNELTEDELVGLASGTVLTAVLRPLGLVMAPRREPGSRVRLLIADVREVEESWPIGSPLADSPFKTAPKLFEYLNVEIQDTLLSDALGAIGPRVEVPFLYDYNSMARHRVDPAQVQVSFPKKRTFYKRILDTILSQARLRSELRIDEAGKPFLWISTLKR